MDDNNEGNSNAFRDFIPAGEDPGAVTEDGFQDFVPAPTPTKQVIEEQPVSPEPAVEVQPQAEQQPVEATAVTEQPQPEEEQRNRGIFDNLKAKFQSQPQQTEQETQPEEELTPVTEEMSAQDQANLSEPFEVEKAD